MNHRVRTVAATMSVALGVAMPLGVFGTTTAANAAGGATCAPVVLGTVTACLVNSRSSRLHDFGVNVTVGANRYAALLHCDATGVTLFTQLGAPSTLKATPLGMLLESMCEP